MMVLIGVVCVGLISAFALMWMRVRGDDRADQSHHLMLMRLNVVGLIDFACPHVDEGRSRR